MENLKTFLDDNKFYKNLYTDLETIVQQNSHRCDNYSRSRTLNDLLNYTVNRWTNSDEINGYQLLEAICGLLLNGNRINIRAGYQLITSQMAETLDLDTVINDYVPRPTNTNDLNVNIIHISKGKSYLSKVLDTAPAVERIRQIETYAIEGPNHFIRVYRNFGHHNANDITIFTDVVSAHLLETIIVMLPHICNLKKIETTEDYPELSEKDEKFNQKYENLMKIFTFLFEIYNKLQDPTDPETYRIFVKFLKEYLDLFDFASEKINDFVTNLANARNKIVISKLENDIASLKRNIANYESTLENAYTRLGQYEREFIGISQLQPENLSAFMDTIKNTKAIEILSTTDKTMLLRITAPLQYFLSEDFETYEKNENSEYNNSTRNNPNLQRIFHKIFVTREYNLIMQAVIKLEINSNSWDSTPLALTAIGNLSNFTEFPNPHLYHHNCWSKAKDEILKHIKENNYELVVMQMIAAVQSVNIAERVSFICGMLNDLLNEQYKPYVHIMNMKTHAILTLDEALVIERQLKAQEAAKEAEQILAASPKEGYSQVEIPDDDDNWDDNLAFEEDVSHETDND